MSFKLWYCLDDKSRELLTPLLPTGWQDPAKLQDIEPLREIDIIMRQKPRGTQAIVADVRPTKTK